MNNEELLRKLISYETVTDSYEEIKSCFQFIRDYLKENNSLFFQDYCFSNHLSLFVKNTKSDDLDILFLGHIDVVAGERKQFTARKRGNKLYGRGSFDMKGHDAVMINIMRNLKSKKKIGLILTSDEEHGGFYGIPKIMEETPFSASLVIVPDGGNNFDLILEEKGVLQLEISAFGMAAHGSTPYKGENAIEKLMDIYQKIKELYPGNGKDEYQTTINLGIIRGGNTVNIVPDEALMQLDIRHIYTDSKEQIIQNIQKIDSHVMIKILAEGDAYHLDLHHKEVIRYIKICEKILGKSIEKTTCDSASDARFFEKYHMPAIIMNASGANMHGRNEYIELDSLKVLSNIYQELVQ